MMHRFCLSIFLLMTLCFSTLAQKQYCELFENSSIQQIDLAFHVSFAETNQLAETAHPKPLGLFKHFRFQPAGKTLNVRTWHTGRAESSIAKKLLQNAPDSYSIGVLGSELSTKETSPDKMLALLGRFMAGEWW